jgi:hypothetical protein
MTRKAQGELVADFALRLLEETGENIWRIGLTADGEAKALAQDLVEHVNAIEAGAAVWQHVASVEAFRASVHDGATRIWVGSGFGIEVFGAESWSRVDRDRTRFLSRGIVTLVLPHPAFELIQLHAPNLTSWIGGAVFELTRCSPMSPEAKEARLQELRTYAGMGDEEFLRRAAEGTLEPDPLHSEWLVLLGRGDLLGNG